MDRRQFFALAAGAAAAVPLAATAVRAQAGGSLDAATLGLTPGAPGDQGAALQAAIERAAAEDRALFLPPGTYRVANVTLPARTRLTGVAGATRLVFAGGGHFFYGGGAELVHLSGLSLDGGGIAFPDGVPGVIYLADVPDVLIDNCTISGSGLVGLALDGCGGRVINNDITTAADAGLRVVNSVGLLISGNSVTDCANNGILVFRWEEGEDGTIVSQNRVERIRADAGGTGENGNGINVFQAGSVIVSNNRIADCAFTAVRGNTADNITITGNNCSRLGEVGLYAEFGFQGAVIANNVVDTAAVGISVANLNVDGRLATVTGNVIRNLQPTGPYPEEGAGFGIGIAVEADAAVTANVIDGGSKAGMWLGWGPFVRNLAVTGNVIRGLPVGIAVTVVDGAGTIHIADNVISGASRGAVVGMNHADTATGDLTAAGAPGFPHLTLAGNRAG